MHVFINRNVHFGVRGTARAVGPRTPTAACATAQLRCARGRHGAAGNRWHMPVERAAFNLNLNLMPRDIQSMYSRDCTRQGPLRAVPAHLHNF